MTSRPRKVEIKLEGRPVWVEVRLGALAQNLSALQRHMRETLPRGSRGPLILAVVKANAYGHGAVPVARALAKAGADWFGVACTAEGAELRNGGIRKPILVMGGFWPGEEKHLLAYRLTPAITRLDQLCHLERAAARDRRGQRARIGFHLKVDSGMNRLGISPQEVDALARILPDCPHLRLEGTFTHLASSDILTSEQTERQEAVFAAVLDRLRGLRVSPGIVHMANSAGVAARPSTWADMVRPGAMLYGYHQFYDPPERTAEVAAKLRLEPALSFRARVISVREIPANQPVGYSARFVTKRPSRIGVIVAGYADGLPRGLSNSGRVIVRGQFVPIVGSVSMDLTAVDLTGLDEAALGDIATIYGTDGPAAQYPPDVARCLNTVTSDVLCALGRRVPRFYLP